MDIDCDHLMNTYSYQGSTCYQKLTKNVTVLTLNNEGMTLYLPQHMFGIAILVDLFHVVDPS